MKKEHKLIIKNGRVIDPAGNLDDRVDILVEDSKITRVAKDIKEPHAQLIDAADKLVVPGIVDMHVHLREPGREDKETIATGTAAALKGGVTSVLAMPNTQPAIDSAEHVKLLQKMIASSAHAHVFIAGAITKERAGKALVNIVQLKKSGVVAITDDGSSVDSDSLMGQALRQAKKQNIVVICHCEDKILSGRGVANLGFASTRLGLRGISRESEYKRVERDISLAQKAGAAIHIAHVSCAESVEIISKAKKKGIRVTAETCPHYFSLDEEAISGYDGNMKMNPPLRTKDDVRAIKAGLQKGIIDAIASDHAPHTANEKNVEFEFAEFGVVGLETLISVSVTELIDTGVLTWNELVRKLSMNPAKILRIPKGSLQIGSDADITILSPGGIWEVTRESLISKSKNSAFLNKKLKGIVEYTILSGNIVHTGS